MNTGSHFTMKRLGYIALPAVLRMKIGKVKDSLDMKNDPYPPRLDGGYGWFIVQETENESEYTGAYGSGCNSAGDKDKDMFHYYHIGKYFNNNVYHNGGIYSSNSKLAVVIRCIRDANIPCTGIKTNARAELSVAANGKLGIRTAEVSRSQYSNGVLPHKILQDDDRVRLIKANLITSDGETDTLNFACFTDEQFVAFRDRFNRSDNILSEILAELIKDIHKSFKGFVPKRLDSQINQWVSCYVHNIIGFVTEELINRGVLEKPNEEKPLTNGVFYISGKHLSV